MEGIIANNHPPKSEKNREKIYASFLIIILKQRSQNGCLSLWKNVGSSNGLSQPYITTNTDQNTLETGEGGGEHTVQTKHSQHHLPPSASTALIPSRMLILHFLHFGILNRT